MVGEEDRVRVEVEVDEGVGKAVPCALYVSIPVKEATGGAVRRAVWVEDREREGVGGAEAVGVRVSPEGVAREEGEGVKEAGGEGVVEGEGVEDPLLRGDPELDTEGVSVGDAWGLALGLLA